MLDNDMELYEDASGFYITAKDAFDVVSESAYEFSREALPEERAEIEGCSKIVQLVCNQHDELVACLRELMECAGTPFSELRRRKFEAAKARAEMLLEGK